MPGLPPLAMTGPFLRLNEPPSLPMSGVTVSVMPMSCWITCCCVENPLEPVLATGVDVVPVTYRARADVLVEKISLPAVVRRGEPFDVHDDMMRLTLRVVGEALMSTNLTGDAAEIERLLTDEILVACRETDYDLEWNGHQAAAHGATFGRQGHKHGQGADGSD